MSHGFDSVKRHAIDTVGGAGGLWARCDYDANGNVKVRHKGLSTQQTLTWNQENRLASLTAAGLSESYLYHGYGKYRLSGALPTGHRYTGQKFDTATGLMYYNARYYNRRESPGRGTFLSPDTLVPDPANAFISGAYDYIQAHNLWYTMADDDTVMHCFCGRCKTLIPNPSVHLRDTPPFHSRHPSSEQPDFGLMKADGCLAD